MKTINYVLNAPLSKNYKIALLADMHSKVNPRILPRLQSNNPDMICIAGDLFMVGSSSNLLWICMLR